MSRTLREYKGKKHREKVWRKKSPKDKFMGYTSGQHSHKEGDEAPIKNKDFVKYGYPDGLYPKRIYLQKKKNYPDSKYPKQIF